jgi:hypothetical protein
MDECKEMVSHFEYAVYGSGDPMNIFLSCFTEVFRKYIERLPQGWDYLVMKDSNIKIQPKLS